jgi:hypothetical protein
MSQIELKVTVDQPDELPAIMIALAEQMGGKKPARRGRKSKPDVPEEIAKPGKVEQKADPEPEPEQEEAMDLDGARAKLAQFLTKLSEKDVVEVVKSFCPKDAEKANISAVPAEKYDEMFAQLEEKAAA